MKRETDVLQGGTEKHDAFRALQKVVGMIRAMAPWGKGRGRGTGPCVLSQGLWTLSWKLWEVIEGILSGQVAWPDFQFRKVTLTEMWMVKFEEAGVEKED